MSIPTLDKTWQFSVNNNRKPFSTVPLWAANLVREIKNNLIGFSLNPWIVEYSSDSVTAGSAGDNVDRWTADSDVVFAAGDHSWVILKQSGILSNFQICWDLNANDSTNTTMVVSPSAGFTGGTISARPTATDEYVIGSTTDWGVGDDARESFSYHMMMSTDGECTRVVFVQGNGSHGGVSGLWAFDKPKNPVSGWTNPWVALYANGNGGAATGAAKYVFIRDNQKVYSTLPNGPTQHVMYLTSEGTEDTGAMGESNVNNSVNEISGEVEFFPAGVACEDTPNIGRHGDLFDFWFGPEGVSQGRTFPDDGTRLIAVFEHIALPWDGTSEVLNN